MRFVSTGPERYTTALEDAITHGLAPDGGVYVPERINRLDEVFVRSIADRSREEICEEMAFTFLGGTLTRETVRSLVEEAITFDAPLVELSPTLATVELFHGPTLAFKDFGARFMAALTMYLRRDASRMLTVLVATSGDTGGAVGHGFYGRDGVRVVILYPSGRISELQEKQLTTMGGNVTAVEVDGSFDDCQRLAKLAFADSDLGARIDLTSANSINLGRLIPQTFYYALALKQMRLSEGEQVVFSVPSGNFGSLTGGLFAKMMGLRISRFIAATNANDVVPEYLTSGVYTPRPSIRTLSNAMDVGTPNNFARILSLYDRDLERIRRDISGASFTDSETVQAIKEVYDRYGYVLDPHGAVAYLGAKREGRGERRIFLHPAHPAKFSETVRGIVRDALVVPDVVKETLLKEKFSIPLENSYEKLKEFLIASV